MITTNIVTACTFSHYQSMNTGLHRDAHIWTRTYILPTTLIKLPHGAPPQMPDDSQGHTPHHFQQSTDQYHVPAAAAAADVPTASLRHVVSYVNHAGLWSSSCRCWVLNLNPLFCLFWCFQQELMPQRQAVRWWKQSTAWRWGCVQREPVDPRLYILRAQKHGGVPVKPPWKTIYVFTPPWVEKDKLWTALTPHASISYF